MSVCYVVCYCIFFFFKQKTAYEMRISDWSSDVCSSDLLVVAGFETDIVEHEEFGFGADIDGVADAGRGDIGLGALRGRARVAGIAFAGRRLDDVAEDHEHRGRRKGIVIDRVEVGLQVHVGLVDRLPALDRSDGKSTRLNPST